VITIETVWTQLRDLEDKMFGTPLSVVDVGLIYDVEVRDRDVHVTVAVFNRGHLQINSLSSPVRQKVLEMDGVGEVTVECVWEPEWTPDRLSQKARDVLGFEKDDPVEGSLHVRSEEKADPDVPPFDKKELDRDHLVIPRDSWGLVVQLPKDRFAKWWGGWRFCKRFKLEERDGLPRRGEPIYIDCAFAADQIRDMAKEIRLVEEGSGEEIPCQVYAQKKNDSTKSCTIVFLAAVNAAEYKTYLVLYGNSSPACWKPIYQTDLEVRGEEYALEIENSYYKARLSPVMGHLRNLEFKRWGKTMLDWYAEPTPINLTDASNDPKGELDIAWHGEHNCIHWTPDFSNQLRFRMTNWPEPPNYEVVRGPICTIVRRWGYPVTPIHPALPQTAVSIEVTYVFYSGLPYFTMESRLDVEKEVDIEVVRYDQWLFDNAFTHALYMLEGEDVEISAEGMHFKESNPALLGFFNEHLKDAFASLRLSFDGRGFPNAYHPKDTGIWMRSFGQKIWNRTAFQAGGKTIAIQPGATIWEYNAYLAYNIGEEGGHDQAGAWYNLLRRPLHVTR
jgi:metal-sulfur cluster biosynthetic enzyme